MHMKHRICDFHIIAVEIDKAEGYGATSVRNFVEASNILGDRSEDEWQQNVSGRMGASPGANGMGG